MHGGVGINSGIAGLGGDAGFDPSGGVPLAGVAGIDSNGGIGAGCTWCDDEAPGRRRDSGESILPKTPMPLLELWMTRIAPQSSPIGASGLPDTTNASNAPSVHQSRQGVGSNSGFGGALSIDQG